MKKILIIILLIQINSIFCSDANIENLSDMPIKVRTSVDHSTITTSEEVLFTIELTRPIKSQFKMPEFGEAIQGFRVIDYGNDQKTVAGELIEKYWYKLRADLKGSYILPSIGIVVSKNGKKEEVKTSEIFIEVKSRLDNIDNKTGKKLKQKLKDIKAIIATKESLTALSWILISLFFSAIITFCFFKFYNKRKKNPEQKMISPYDEVLQLFSNLDLIKLDTKDSIKQLAYQLSYLLRNYVERQFLLNVTDMTMNQIQRSLKSVDFSNDCKQRFLKILKDTDLIKFTDLTIDKQYLLDIVDQSKKLIEDIVPKDELKDHNLNEESVI